MEKQGKYKVPEQRYQKGSLDGGLSGDVSKRE